MTPRRQTPPTKRAVAYIRVSSDQQAESGLSLENQREKVRAAATLHDLDLHEVIVDAAESAATLERPGMRRVLELVRAKKIDALIVLKLDRLTRNIRDLADLLDLFRSRKVALMSVSESLNTETAAGRMVTNMLAVIAQWEREAIGERTSAALSAKRARGERAGAVPYGYRLKAKSADEDKAKTLTADPAERRILRLMVECRQAGFSLRDTADELNRKGFTTRAGQPWRFEYADRPCGRSSASPISCSPSWRNAQHSRPDHPTDETQDATGGGFRLRRRTHSGDDARGMQDRRDVTDFCRKS